MHTVRKRKMMFLVFMVSVLAIVTALVMYALRQNISLFYAPAQLVAGEVSGPQTIRVGGMVVKGSIQHGKNDLSVHFKLTDFKETIEVSYKGILPDLFREEQGIVALGTLIDNHHFKAIEVLAKHDANYMPPEVKQALAQTAKAGKESR